MVYFHPAPFSPSGFSFNAANEAIKIISVLLFCSEEEDRANKANGEEMKKESKVSGFNYKPFLPYFFPESLTRTER